MATYGDVARLKINDQNLRALLSKKLEKKIKQLDKELRITIQSPVFEWDSTTKRKNGEIVGSTRNAVDTGKLLNSQRVTFSKNQTATITWSVPYAGVVFDHAKTDLVAFTLARMRNS